MASRPRLFTNQELKCGFEFFLLDQQFHYLANVLRLSQGNCFLAFDDKNGEFECEITAVEKKKMQARVISQTRQYEQSPDIWMMFAPVKKDKTDFIIEKSTELGARKIIPVITRRTISDKIKKERYEAQVIEAAEQCRRVDLPQTADAISLEDLIKNWNPERILYFMDETGNGGNVYEAFSEEAGKKKPSAILTGPEGGFEEKELEFLRKQVYAKGVSMGKRILRTETAAAAALSCWQAICGDWRP